MSAPTTQEGREAEADVAETFSYATACASLDRIFDQIPKTRRMEVLGELNDVSVVLGTLWGFMVAGLDEAGQDEARKQEIRTVLKAYLDRIINPTKEEGDTPT